MPSYANSLLKMRNQFSAAAAELRERSKAETPQHSKGSLQARIALLDEHAHPGDGQAIEVKDFDERGMTFFHRSPLDGRRAMLVLESPQLGRLVAEVDLTWCHFNRAGRYTSGGRFVRQVGKTA